MPQNVNALARPQLEKRQVIKVKLFLKREIIRFVVSDFLLDLAEHASSKDNYVHGDDPPRLLSSTHRQVAGSVDGTSKKCGLVWCLYLFMKCLPLNFSSSVGLKVDHGLLYLRYV